MVWPETSSVPMTATMKMVALAAKDSRVASWMGLAREIGWTTVQDRVKAALRSRERGRSWKRRTRSPSGVTSLRATTTRTVASAIWLPRSLAMRNISDSTPSRRETTATREKSTRAVARENFANISPVAMAVPTMPQRASALTTALAQVVRGTILPYPMVAIVCTEKKNMSRKEPGWAFSTQSPPRR